MQKSIFSNALYYTFCIQKESFPFLMHSKRSSMTDVIPLSYNDNIASFFEEKGKKIILY